MDVSLYQAAAAMSATARWQDMIAENLSAASVPGARKQEMSFSDVAAGMGRAGAFIPAGNAVTNFQAGEMRSTGNPTDFALEGPGFFAVQMPNGKTVYTRDGEFTLNAQKQLVTKEGYAVIGSGGPVQFNANNAGPITISATGDISQGEQTVGKLQTFEFKQPEKLTHSGSGFFRADDSAAQPTPASKTQIRQGFVESANMSPTTEMASLITAMRLFESNQKVLQMQSDRMSKVITDLGGSSAS
jgi:flagellar basal-body rod protein FlgF